MNLNDIKNMSLSEKESTPVPVDLLNKHFIDPDKHLDPDLKHWLDARCLGEESKPTKEEALAYMRVWPRDFRWPPKSVQNAISPPKKRKK